MIKNHFKIYFIWCLILTILSFIWLTDAFKRRKENYTLLHKIVAGHEQRILKLEREK